MKNKTYDIALLLVVLSLFSASLGLLHARKGIHPEGVSISDDVARIIATKQEAITYIDRLIIGGNVDTIARVLHQFDDNVLFETLDAILEGWENALVPEQKIQLLLATILHDPKREKQNIFITKLADRFSEHPVFYYAVDFYHETIPAIISWARRVHRQQIVRRWTRHSFNKAIDMGDLERFKALITQGLRPTKKHASALLRQVVLQSRSPEFVTILIKELGADPNYAHDNKRTILMEAVEENNHSMVRALVTEGADPNLVLDAAIGSAKQLSFQKGYSEIDLIFSGLKKK